MSEPVERKLVFRTFRDEVFFTQHRSGFVTILSAENGHLRTHVDLTRKEAEELFDWLAEALV